MRRKALQEEIDRESGKTETSDSSQYHWQVSFWELLAGLKEGKQQDRGINHPIHCSQPLVLDSWGVLGSMSYLARQGPDSG